MSKLYIRLPARSVAENAEHWPELACPYALTSHGGDIEREGLLPLSTLLNMADIQSVALLLAASDVTLLRVQMPPLSAARLKAALPNMVEDLLIADPSECVIVAGVIIKGLTTVAVVQRAWLDLLNRTLIAKGIRRYTVLPSQLCLPHEQSGQALSAAIHPQGADVEVMLRLSEQDGMGLMIASALDGETCSTADAVLRTLRVIAPDAPITLYAPQAELGVYQEALSRAGVLHINVLADNWQRWIAGAAHLKLDLLKGVAGGATVDWRAWRWPLALAAAVLLVNVAALNIDWWRMKGEDRALRAAMMQTYRSAYPHESVIIDPVAQMRQKMTSARRSAGQLARDDFTVMAASLGDVLGSIKPGRTLPVIAALEYREHSLLVRFKPALSKVEGTAEDMDGVSSHLKAALAERNLTFERMPEKSAEAVFRIRSKK